MADIIVNRQGNAFGDVAPDLSTVYGQSHHGTKRLGSSNPFVKKAIFAQNNSETDTRRLLQRELSINPSKEIVNFFCNLDADSKKEFLRVWKVMRDTWKNKVIATSLGLTENQDIIKQKFIEVGELKDDLNVTINKANQEISQAKGALSDLAEQYKKVLSRAQAEVSQNIDDVRTDAKEKIDSFITSHTSKVEEIESQIKDMLAKATVMTLSSKYDEKRKALNRNYWWAKGIFYVCLCAFCVIGLYTVQSISVMVGGDVVERIAKAILKNVPYYLPLFWFTCHMNKLMSKNRRLMEEYAHKVAVAQTYVGMAEQVEELLKKGVKDASNLSAELMEDTIKVLCANPNACLDKVKSSTPISEVVDSVSKLIRATTELKQTEKK